MVVAMPTPTAPLTGWARDRGQRGNKLDPTQPTTTSAFDSSTGYYIGV
jgi:hypothetical protein